MGSLHRQLFLLMLRDLYVQILPQLATGKQRYIFVIILRVLTKLYDIRDITAWTSFKSRTGPQSSSQRNLWTLESGIDVSETFENDVSDHLPGHERHRET